MDHLAIMKKSWNLTSKILTGEKTIESRWYANKSSPWDKIVGGETVYFKDSGDPIKLKAEVAKVLQFSDLTPLKVKEILVQYGRDICVSDHFFERVKFKKYCILVFLKDPSPIKPFDIDKKGFGNRSAWICVDDINRIKSS